MKLKLLAITISLSALSVSANDNAKAMYSVPIEAKEQVTLGNWMHHDYNHWAF
ncbi:hypothetical protein AB4254_16220 [Vibrio breoganii]